VNQVIGVDLLSQSLLPAIVELAEDKHWRIRLAIIEYIPLLASQLGVAFFDEKLGALCMGWMQDQVYSIREAATINMKRLAEEFGSDWAQTHLVPHILGMAKNGNYLYRMTVLSALAELAPFVSQDVCINSVLTVVLSAAKDRVPNIKFNVARLTQKFVPLVGTSVVESTIRPCLLELNSDADVDVRFFASQSLAVCDACRG